MMIIERHQTNPVTDSMAVMNLSHCRRLGNIKDSHVMFGCDFSTCALITWPGFTLISCHTVLLSSPACHPGFYKAYAGNIKCSKCPPHSFSYGEGAAMCGCEKGFFRAEKDPPTMACTREYDSKRA